MFLFLGGRFFFRKFFFFHGVCFHFKWCVFISKVFFKGWFLFSRVCFFFKVFFSHFFVKVFFFIFPMLVFFFKDFFSSFFSRKNQTSKRGRISKTKLSSRRFLRHFLNTGFFFKKKKVFFENNG